MGTTTTTAAAKGGNAALQAQANEVAVKAGCPASTKTTVNTQKYPSAPAMAIDTSKTYTATVVTTAGTFDISLDAKTAPTTVNNFVFLANKGYYHCVIFHRVIPQFMDQTGDPTGTGEGGPGYTIKDENPPKAANAAQQYPLGSVAMANTGQPNSGGSQFFIVSGPQGESLPNTYALFGSVTSGITWSTPSTSRAPPRASRPTSRSASSPSPSTKAKDEQTMATPTAPAVDGSSPQQRKFDEEPPMLIDTEQALRGDHGHLARHDGDRARPAGRAEDGEQLRVPRPLPLLRRHRVPPHHPGLRAPGRRPHRIGSGGPGYRFDDELPGRRQLQGRLAGHGQRRARTPTAASSS